MERFTKRVGKYTLLTKGKPDGYNCPDDFCNFARVCDKASDRSCPLLEMIDRLADYEDADPRVEITIEEIEENG